MDRRRAIVSLAVAAAGAGARWAAAAEPLPPLPVGLWSCDARLFHAQTRARVGPIASELRLAADGALSGRIGQAEIPRTVPASRSARRVEYRVLLSTPVHPGLDASARHLVVIVTPHPAAQLDAEFHLKRRFGFDPAMLVGHFDLPRAD